MRYTHAVLAALPSTLKFDKKAKVDLEVAQKQHDGLMETLRESGVNIIELPHSESVSPLSVHVGDTAVVINGTALICRPKKEGARLAEVSNLLAELSWTVVECPSTVNGKNAVLEGSDVLYTGKEIFVGIRKHGTNIEGAMFLGRVFCDICVVSVPMSDKAGPLRQYVSLCAPGILSVSPNKEATNILKRMEQEATFRYRTLLVDDEDTANCLFVNGRVVFRQDKNEPKFSSLQSAGMELWALDVSELVKVGSPFSRLCLLVNKIDPKTHH